RMQVLGSEVLDRHGQLLADLPAPGGIRRLDTKPSEVAPVFLDLLLRTEDRRYRQHAGIDPPSLARAALQWIIAGHVVSGGSTLTMQAARLLEPRPRTLRSKLIEMFRATQLEERLGKDGVLEVWLTLAPYGGNLEGVKAGSQAWFGIGPAALDRAQAALLVAIPRRPEALRPDHHPLRALTLRNRLLGDSNDNSPVPLHRIPFPAHAIQAVRTLPHRPVIRTTLDLSLQTGLEALLSRTLQDQPDRVSAAALIADASSRDILAIVSGDEQAGMSHHLGRRDGGRRDENQHAGAMDLTEAVRSPGSALKPMLYGLAFQNGLARPDTILSDLPRHFGDYAPENFDRRFTAPVTAAEALRRSLNVPAVSLLAQLGPVRFVAWLQTAGARLVLPAGAVASLPIALGGGGIRMRDLAALYAALATDGTDRPLRLLADGATPAHALLQASAAALVANVLTRDFPDGGPDGVAWKTGTSWGGRDAWALGFDTIHVGAIWIGRPDGTAIEGATGHDAALPVLSRLFGLLPPAPRPVSSIATTGEARAPIAVVAETSLRILFPPPDAELSMDGPVPVRVMGGRRPMSFLVDGRLLPSHPIRRAVNWLPDGPGFYTLSVIDADGLTDKVKVRVR
ncbi:MAG: transglycosylase domain-containing protein, partial [Janthinobacterium lividum]